MWPKKTAPDGSVIGVDAAWTPLAPRPAPANTPPLPQPKEEPMAAKAKPLAGTLPPTEGLVHMLLTKPPEVRAKVLLDLASANGPHFSALQAAVAQLFHHLDTRNTTTEAAELKACYEHALAELAQGPARPATFIAEADGDMPGLKPRVHVVTPDGQERFPTLLPGVKLEALVQGMTVYLDAGGAVVLGVSRKTPDVGQAATFLRRLPGSAQVEVHIRDEHVVLHAAGPVLEAEQAGRLVRGDRVLLCPKRQFAFAVIPREQDRRYRYIHQNQLPPVVAERDIGQPHWALHWLIRRTRLLLFRPDLLQRFDLRPRCAVLMTGPSGTGKTLTIRAFLHAFERLLIERTGRADLGSRVIQAKVSELLSEWLGRSDKNIEELFNDIHAVAAEEVETAQGERMYLPVVVLLEEVEGIARRRGEWDGGIYDRIVGTLLQRLDDATHDLGKLPVILIATSNRPDLIDAAMWRRLAGVRAHFTRLDRDGLLAVLGKKIPPQCPLAGGEGHASEERRARLIDQVVDWFYGPAVENHRLVEIRLRDGQKAVKYRQDFLTGAVVEQAVSSAIDQAVFQAEEAGAERVSLSAEGLIEAFRQHVDGLADNLTPANAGDYVDLPEHTPPAAVRRLGPASSVSSSPAVKLPGPRLS
jgi:ATP-dependent 26S proteasome regulatory subunit